MKLQQLRYLVIIVDNGLNITAASEALFTSQPGVSKQIRLLEDELFLQLIVRKSKSLTALTQAGQKVLQRASLVLSETENIKALSGELAGEAKPVATSLYKSNKAAHKRPSKNITPFRSRLHPVS